jgi:hypothetical protein
MMIDRCSNKVAIISQDRLQPMDKEDYPIKVLDMAPFIIVTLPTVSSFFSTFRCFLRGGRSSSGDLTSLSSLWMASRCECLSPYEWRRLQDFRVEDPLGARKGGPDRPPEWAKPALGRPAQAHPDPVWSPLYSRGSSGDYSLCPFHLHDFDHVILASKMEVLRA